MKRIDFKKKFREIIKIILEYPLSLLIEIGGIFLGLNEKSSVDKMKIIFKLFKTFGKIIFTYGVAPSL